MPTQRSEVKIVPQLLMIYFQSHVALVGSPVLPVGQIVENVVCARDGSQSYALYIPSDYDPGRKWPVLFALDPAASGSIPVRVFREAAERYGYVVVGSNNSQNGPVVVGFNALGAMWKDISDLLSIDPNRVYLTGFSGGARMAGEFAQLGKSVAGLIACGAGFTLKNGDQKIPFTFVGVSGTWDMNYLELKNVTADLVKKKVSSRLITFEGGHQWPPPKACSEALEWLELASFRRGLSEVDRQLVDDLFRRETARAERLEESGQLFQAYRTYLDLRNDFQGLKDPREIDRKVAGLKGSKALGSSAKQLEQIEKTESRYITKLLREFLAESRHESLDWWQGQINAIQALDEEYELVTKRLLEFVWRNGYEKSWFAERDGNLERAVYLAQVSLLVRPQDPYLNYNLARLQALDHQLETALKTLRLAVASGYSDRDRIESDLAFAPFLENPELQEILDRIGDQ